MEKSVPEKTGHEVLHRCWKALTILAYKAKEENVIFRIHTILDKTTTADVYTT